MARTAVIVRANRRPELPPGLLARRAGWVLLTGFWLFLVVALASFDSADWPSHTVAVHNEPTHNLCGFVGALIAYWSYYVLGIGSWVILAGVAGYLAAAARGRAVGHLLLRATGLALMGLAVSGLHGLLASQAGPLAGSHAGLVAVLIVGELGHRFSDVGTLLALLAGFGVGSIVAVGRVRGGPARVLHASILLPPIGRAG